MAKEGTEVVTYGSARVLVRKRGNGLYKVSWREAKKPGGTTKTGKLAAMKFAQKKARELSAGQGGSMVTAADSALLDRLKKVSGPDRSPFAVLDELESAVKKYGGWSFFGRAVQFYDQSGLAAVEKVTVKDAFDRFLKSYVKRDQETIETFEKEIGLFCKTYGTLIVSDITETFLENWANRRKEDGSPAAPRTFNNRLDAWRTFLNRCRKWNLWPKGEKHPGETLEREPEPDTIPEIFKVEVGKALLELVIKEQPKLLNYLVVGCWLGPRPKEIERLVPELFDWQRGYVNMDSRVANKVKQQRFTPIPENVRNILGNKIVDPRSHRGLSRGSRKTAICGTMDAEFLSRLARKHGVIEVWPADVMRHSYISYRLAQGHSRSQVAEWAGNSESEILESYRRPLMKEEGEDWFKIGLL